MLVKPENSNESVSEKEECMRPESVDLKAEEEVLELTESCDSKTKQSLYEVFFNQLFRTYYIKYFRNAC